MLKKFLTTHLKSDIYKTMNSLMAIIYASLSNSRRVFPIFLSFLFLNKQFFKGGI